jgi:hypothetical protein
LREPALPLSLGRVDCARMCLRTRRAGWSAAWLSLLPVIAVQGQIDPYERQLLHVGYNQPLEGKSPLAAYAFYLHNQTNFLREDWTLRAAVAPVWLDAQLGWKNLLGPQTDVGLIVAGGGFARTYNEIRLGDWKEGESFLGHGYTVGAAVYHLFNPDQRLPLQAVLAATTEGSFYDRDDDVDDDFVMPPDTTSPVVRGGLRLGGQEPDLRSPFAFEVSAWYESRWRLDHGPYGFNGDRELEALSQLFWGRLLGRYSTPDLRHDIEFSLTAGTGDGVDRFSAYRLGGMLPFASEFPLSIPGYYHQELSARNFLLLSGNYSFALSPGSAWRLALFGAASSADYVDGLEYPSQSNSGVGGGVGWRAPRRDWIITAFYGYGFDALRDDSVGAHMVGLVLQYDFRLEGGWDRFLASPRLSHGLLRLFGR